MKSKKKLTMKSRQQIFAMIIGISLFTSCGEGLNSSSETSANSIANSGTDSLLNKTQDQSLNISPSWMTAGTGDYVTITATGGSMPATWSVVSPGDGSNWIVSQDNATVVYRNDTRPELVTLRVTDRLGATADIAIHTVKRNWISGESSCQINTISNAMKCWGRAGTGILGYGDVLDRGNIPDQMGINLPEVNLGTNRKAYMSDGVVGDSSGGRTCVIVDTGDVKCFGLNTDGIVSGILGYGDSINRGDSPDRTGDQIPYIDLGQNRKALQLAVDQRYTCVILDTHQVKCFGDNPYGNLGYGDTFTRGQSAIQMGDGLPFVNLGTNRSAVQVDASYYYTCAILDTGDLKCWGAETSSILGYGDTNRRGTIAGEMGDDLPSIQLGTGRKASQISMGRSHMCALLDDGNLKCWGQNNSGQLGIGTTVQRGNIPNSVGDTLPTVKLGTGRTPISVSAGKRFTCVLLSPDNQVKCFGVGESIGLGRSENRGDEFGEMGGYLPFVDIGTGRQVRQLSSDHTKSCVILDDGGTKCWGNGSDAGTGYGDMYIRGDGPGEMGELLPYVQLW